MTTTAPHPVDSTTRSCCGGIGRHTTDCAAAGDTACPICFRGDVRAASGQVAAHADQSAMLCAGSGLTLPRVARYEMPPIPTPTGEEISQHDTYATVTCGEIAAEVQRFAYWNPKDQRADDVDITFEATIDGLPDHCGLSDVYADNPAILHQLAAVASAAARLLEEARNA